jgi:predicted DNA binding CopG/RHH family protein
MTAVKYLSNHKVHRQALKNDTIENFKAQALEQAIPFSILIREKLQDFVDNKFDIRSIHKRKLEFISVKVPEQTLSDLRERATRHGLTLGELIRIVLEYEPSDEELRKLKKNSIYFKKWKKKRKYSPPISAVPEPTEPLENSIPIEPEFPTAAIGDSLAPLDTQEDFSNSSEPLTQQEVDELLENREELIKKEREENMFPLGKAAGGELPSAILADKELVAEIEKCTCEITLDPCPIHDVGDEDDELEEAFDE